MKNEEFIIYIIGIFIEWKKKNLLYIRSWTYGIFIEENDGIKFGYELEWKKEGYLLGL